MRRAPWTPASKPHPFDAWSPKRLADALGYRLELRPGRGGVREAYLIGPTSREHPTDHRKAWASLATLATFRGIDPNLEPAR